LTGPLFLIGNNDFKLEGLMSKRIPLFVAVALAASPFGLPAAKADDSTLVFAAASLKNALDAAVEDYSKTTGKTVTVSYAASSVLAKQIEEAAPADIFFSADLDWMDKLQEKNRIAADSRVTLLGNDIVLVAPKDSTVSLIIAPNFPLAGALGDGKLAMALTASVPAGKYGKAALEKLGVWDSVSANVAEAENVRAALALVSRGEAPLGIVYTTDANADKGVKVVGTFPEASHPPILYPVALTATAKQDARAFLDYMISAKAKLIFEAQGFRFIAPGS
jgi:molybdate transport system substrate-binding protein